MPESAIKAQVEWDSPASQAIAITPSDSVDLSVATRGIYVGGAGNVSLIGEANGGVAVTFAGVPAGTVLPIRASRVRVTGTTATSLVALY